MADKTVSSLTSSTPTIDDLTISYDNADTSELKKTTWQLVRDLFKTYFDTIYQAVLVSGTNIKTVNGNSLVGSGDIVISGGGSVATDAIWDSKGDLAGGTGANTASRLTVGTNGQVLTADSAEVTGLKWSNPAGGGDALTSGTLAQFAATTSLQLKGVISDETGSGSLVFATSPTLVTPILGTPTSGTLTNCTGLPLSGVVDSTSEALGVGTLELGHASDTTISRISAGVIAVEGVTVPTISSTSTETNKTMTGATNTITARLLKSATTEVDVSSATAPSSGQVLTATSSTTATWQTPSSGGSDVGCTAYNPNVTTIPSQATWTNIQLNQEFFDSGGDYNTSTYRFTAPTTGMYFATASIYFTNAVDTVNTGVSIYKNGSQSLVNYQSFSGAYGMAYGPSGALYLTAGDYLELFAYHNGTTRTIASNNTPTYLSVIKVN